MERLGPAGRRSSRSSARLIRVEQADGPAMAAAPTCGATVIMVVEPSRRIAFVALRDLLVFVVPLDVLPARSVPH